MNAIVKSPNHQSNMKFTMIKFDEQSIMDSKIAPNKYRKLISAQVQRFSHEKDFRSNHSRRIDLYVHIEVN